MLSNFFEKLDLSYIFEISFLGRSLDKWLIALSIFVVSLLIRKVVGSIIVKIANYSILKKRSFTSKYRKQFQSIFSWILPLATAKISVTYILKADIRVDQFVDKILQAILILIILLIVELICRELFAYLKNKNSEKMSETVYRYTLQIIRAILFALGLIMILSLFGISVAGIITGFGLGGLAISMAAKDYLTDLIAGFSIMSEKTFEIGDEIKSPDIEGTVVDIKFRQTILRAYDQGLLSVPNSKLTQNYLVNYSKMGKRRLRFNLYLPLTATKDQVKNLKEIIGEYVLANTATTDDKPIIAVYSIDKESIEILVQYYISSIKLEDLLVEQEQVFQLAESYLIDEDFPEPIKRIKLLSDAIEIQ